MRYAIIVLLIFALYGCKDTDEPIDTDDSTNYEIVEIDGMTCVKWEAHYRKGGLTCNWDEYQERETNESP